MGLDVLLSSFQEYPQSRISICLLLKMKMACQEPNQMAHNTETTLVAITEKLPAAVISLLPRWFFNSFKQCQSQDSSSWVLEFLTKHGNGLLFSKVISSDMEGISSGVPQGLMLHLLLLSFYTHSPYEGFSSCGFHATAILMTLTSSSPFLPQTPSKCFCTDFSMSGRCGRHLIINDSSSTETKFHQDYAVVHSWRCIQVKILWSPWTILRPFHQLLHTTLWKPW